jgi:Arc/MetJ family transcription regulator
MKRTSLVLDEELPERAVRILSVKAYSAAVNLALAEAIRLREIESLADLCGKLEREGGLSALREDRLLG